MSRQTFVRSAIVFAITSLGISGAFGQDASPTDSPTEPASDPTQTNTDNAGAGLTFEATYPPDPTQQDNQWAPTVESGPPNWLAEIEEPMRRSQRWRDRWMLFYGSATVLQLAVGATADDPGLRADGVVGAASSAIGFVAVLAAPYPMATSPVRYAQNRDVPLDGAFTDAGLASEFEAGTLEAERFGRSWMAHAGGAFVSVLGGAVLYWGYERPASAVFNVITGLIATELQIATMPRTTPWIDPERELVGWQMGGTF